MSLVVAEEVIVPVKTTVPVPPPLPPAMLMVTPALLETAPLYRSDSLESAAPSIVGAAELLMIFVANVTFAACETNPTRAPEFAPLNEIDPPEMDEFAWLRFNRAALEPEVFAAEITESEDPDPNESAPSVHCELVLAMFSVSPAFGESVTDDAVRDRFPAVDLMM
ncbi:MAG: hypothetical protein WA771_04125 [Chthoniobacterales bacterium]